MRADKRKVVVVGTGMVGISYVHCPLNQPVCGELVLIGVNKKRAEGEAMDLDHGLALANSSIVIYAGEYDDCRDADIMVIYAGMTQKQGETRLDLLKRDVEVFRSITELITSSGLNGLFLVITSPIDIMTRITCILSGFNLRRVMGTGTALDTTRLGYLLGDCLKTGPRDVHAYVMEEHGDSEFVPWSRALLATKPILELCGENGEAICRQRFDDIGEEIHTATYKIIETKNAAYYGIGMALTRITKAILGDEHSVFTMSAMLQGEYSRMDVFADIPCIINRNGVQRVLPLSLIPEELGKLGRSCNMLREGYDGIF